MTDETLPYRVRRAMGCGASHDSYAAPGVAETAEDAYDRKLREYLKMHGLDRRAFASRDRRPRWHLAVA